jgi:hypothetical protein
MCAIPVRQKKILESIFLVLQDIQGVFIRMLVCVWSITKDVYDKKHQEYADKLQLLEIELSEHREADYEYQTTISTVISVARRAKDIFENCSEPIQKRAFLNFLLQNPTVKDKRLIYSLRSPFDVIADAEYISLLRGQDSNL